MQQYLACLAFDGGPHLWSLRSQHRTSGGLVSYFGCPCGRWEVELNSATLFGAQLKEPALGSQQRAGQPSCGSVPASSPEPYPQELERAVSPAGTADRLTSGHAETHR